MNNIIFNFSNHNPPTEIALLLTEIPNSKALGFYFLFNSQSRIKINHQHCNVCQMVRVPLELYGMGGLRLMPVAGSYYSLCVLTSNKRYKS